MINDPTVELARYRKHMLIYKVLTFISLGLLLAIDLRQSAEIDDQSAQLTADTHALDNLMESDQRLKEAADHLQEICSRKDQPFPVPLNCHQDGGILICDGGTFR